MRALLSPRRQRRSRARKFCRCARDRRIQHQASTRSSPASRSRCAVCREALPASVPIFSVSFEKHAFHHQPLRVQRQEPHSWRCDHVHRRASSHCPVHDETPRDARQQAFDPNVAASHNERCKTDPSGVLLNGASFRNIFVWLLDDGPLGDVSEPVHDAAIRLPHGNLAASAPTRRLSAPRRSPTVKLEAHTNTPLFVAPPLSLSLSPLSVPPRAGICIRSIWRSQCARRGCGAPGRLLVSSSAHAPHAPVPARARPTHSHMQHSR